MNRMVYLFSMGHFSVDWCQGAVPALLPYFIAQYGLSYQDAATLIFANMMVASAIQPVFGWLSDRVSMPWLIPLGPVLCGAGIFGISFCSSYETLFAAVMMSGLGSSLYHPEGALMVNRIAGAVRGRAMGTFSVGGNAGFAVGPALAGLCAYGLGIEWLFLFAAVNAALAAALFFCMPKAEAAAAETSRAEAKNGAARSGTDGALSGNCPSPSSPGRWFSPRAIRSFLFTGSMCSARMKRWGQTLSPFFSPRGRASPTAAAFWRTASACAASSGRRSS